MSLSRKARREIAWIIFLLSCLSVSYFLIFGDGGYLKLREYKSELNELRRENIKLLKTQRALRTKIEDLKNDPDAFERLARERYHFARPGDIIVTIPE